VAVVRPLQKGSNRGSERHKREHANERTAEVRREGLDRMVFVHGKSVATPNDPKLSDRLQEAAPADREKEQAGAVRGAAPAGAQAAEQPA
jgi:hypothetical protein